MASNANIIPFPPRLRALDSGHTRGRRPATVTVAEALSAAIPRAGRPSPEQILAGYLRGPVACEPCPEPEMCPGEAGCEVLTTAADGSPMTLADILAREG
jgi:hypothetical protein